MRRSTLLERQERPVHSVEKTGGRVMLGAFMGTLAVLIAASVQAQGLVLEAEVLEGSAAIALPGLTHDQVRYVLLHHKHQKDQASLAAWLRSTNA
jgi:hypothetical protein